MPLKGRKAHVARLRRLALALPHLPRLDIIVDRRRPRHRARMREKGKSRDSVTSIAVSVALVIFVLFCREKLQLAWPAALGLAVALGLALGLLRARFEKRS